MDFLDQLAQSGATHEKDAHKPFENNRWMLGRKYLLLSSNAMPKSVVGTCCDSTLEGNSFSKKPDLLLSQDYGDGFV